MIWANVVVNHERWKRDEVKRLTTGVNTRQTKQKNNLLSLLHVNIMYAANVHRFCPRELNNWTKSPSGQVRTKECDDGRASADKQIEPSS